MANPPLLSPEFSRVGGLLKIKAYPDAPTEINTWDLSAEFGAIVTAQNTANTAETHAQTGITNAATALAAANEADDTADAAQATANAALPQANLPDCAYLSPQMFRTTITGFATPLVQAGQWTHSFSELNGNLSTAECQILLAAHDYVYSIGYVKVAAGGKLGIYVDGVQKDLIDMYNATTLLGQYFTNTLIDGLTAGLHTIRLRVDGHNALSSAFNCAVSYIAIRRKP